jgi:hypothetical protein
VIKLIIAVKALHLICDNVDYFPKGLTYDL